MYAIIDGLCFISGIVGFILCFTQKQPQYCPIPIVWCILYPVLNELIYNLFANLVGQKIKYDQTLNSRIIYHPSYNISFCGLQKIHPFDSKKYGNVFRRLQQMNIIKGQNSFHIQPSTVPRKLLLEKMSWVYLLKLNYSIAICSYIQMPLCFIPAFLLRWRVLTPMLLATQGTILASIVALKLKWAVNLSGGYHHAYCQKGGGFCIYPDITLAAHYLQTRYGIKKVMIVDLDAHQGNGHERDHLDREDIFIVDAYNHHIYPGDRTAKKAISKDISVKHQTTSQQYLQQILAIEDSIHEFKPQFVIYNAGTDCLVGDPLGNLSISQQGIIKRDQIIFDMCIRNKIPVVMILSGGYQAINAKVIANSIQNLYHKFDNL